jgi:microcin C transport system substrate-binding protein
VIPFFRTGTWRWLRVPDEGNVKIATTFNEWGLYWIDEDLKKQTEEARKSGAKLPPEILTFDQYKVGN